jgi:ferredoxin
MTDHIVRIASGAQFAAGADENLLAAAQRAHWLVRYGCRNGNCQACAATLLEGSVVQADACIEATSAAQPTVLLCLCRARSDLRIGLPGEPLHGSREQARRYYSRINSIRYGATGREGADAELHITLPAGRAVPIHAGQYVLLEYAGELLRAEIDTTVSTGRDLYLHCATAQDFAAERYLTAIGPLGYCYADAATATLLVLSDSPRSPQVQLLKAALPHAVTCDAARIGELAEGAVFQTVLACAHDPRHTVAWYRALLERRIAFDEFRSDDAIRYRWRVWRQDDNGNRFALGDALDEDEARRLAADYERRGHKQLYWAEPMAPHATAPTR